MLEALAGVACAALLCAVVLTAWVCDDAWFSLRSAWNLVHDYGLVFNPGERVQVFTSPLWTMLLAAPLALGLPAYPAALLLSGICSAAVALLFARRGAAGPGGAALALVLLASSKAFVDYSTSGLENPLVHLLYLAFLLRWTREPRRHPQSLALLASLLLLTRLDLALLVLPHLLWLVVSRGGLRRVGALLLGFLPLLAWEGFSVFYYGSPVPNTALAKLAFVGLDRGFLLERGLGYLLDPLAWDPLTLPVMALAVLAAVFGPRRTTLPTAAGVLLYTGWVVWMGGDFMAGRFLAAPFLGAVFVLAWLPCWQRLRWLVPALLPVIAVAMFSPRAPMNVWDGADLDPDADGYTAHQLADERLIYHQRGGLWARLASDDGLVREAVDGPHDLIVFEEVAGWSAFIAGPGCHVVNPYALGDAFLARQVADPPDQTRAGHVTRHVPSRYLDSIRADENLLEDAETAALLDDVWLVTRAPLKEPARLEALLRLWGLEAWRP